MAAAIVVSESVRVPGHALHVRAARASGPGGQNVNKGATQGELRVDPGAIEGLSDAARTWSACPGTRTDSLTAVAAAMRALGAGPDRVEGGPGNHGAPWCTTDNPSSDQGGVHGRRRDRLHPNRRSRGSPLRAKKGGRRLGIRQDGTDVEATSDGVQARRRPARGKARLASVVSGLDPPGLLRDDVPTEVVT